MPRYNNPRVLKTFAVMLLLLLHVACAAPAQRLDARAKALGLEQRLLTGGAYKLTAYAKDGPATAPLRVYLEGDGSPWLNRYTVSPDPTPRQPLALELLALDPGPALYLGRPCYHGQSFTPPCHPLLWTDRRYGPEVVDSLVAAIRAFQRQRQNTDLVLIGYSGGGVLARLLAERLSGVRALVTVAANLDIDRWTALHDFSPLRGSFNPVRRPPLAADVVQLHLAGGRDRNVPPELVNGALAGEPGAQVEVYADFDHRCCWASVWSTVLARLSRIGSITARSKEYRRF